jgi:methylated-DNA-[protein]-cysteine S-methyltransferase
MEPAMTGHHFTIFDTAIGRCGIVWGARGIISVQLPMGDEKKTRARLQHAMTISSRRRRRRTCSPPSRASSSCSQASRTISPTSVLDLDGVPEFNRGVYDIARTIPPGKTMTYGDIARKLGGVELSRDVGQALGRKPLSDRGASATACWRPATSPAASPPMAGWVTKLKMLAIEGAAVNHTPSLFD